MRALEAVTDSKAAEALWVEAISRHTTLLAIQHEKRFVPEDQKENYDDDIQWWQEFLALANDRWRELVNEETERGEVKQRRGRELADSD